MPAADSPRRPAAAVRQPPAGGWGFDAPPTTVVKIRRHDKMAALKILAQHFKIIGEDNDGVNQLANALADRLNAAKKRILTAEDAVIIEPAQGSESMEPAAPVSPT